MADLMFVPIQKVDEEQRIVWGYGSREEPDQANEIMDFATSAPYFQRWTDMSKARSGGKSMGNVRAMHGNVAAGRLVSFDTDHANKGFYVGAHVVDDNEWKKVKAGVYTGFSIGGAYVKRWPDQQHPGLIRYTADPKELSLVDAPCVPGATFDVIKADGMEKREFQAGANTAAVAIETGDGYTKTIKVVNMQDNDLEKTMPGVPAPVATVAAGDKPQGPFHVEQVPNQETPMEIKTSNGYSGVPDQAALQTATVDSADVTSEIEKLLPRLEALIKQAVAEALEKAGFDESKHPRDGGKFTSGGGGGGDEKPAAEKKPASEYTREKVSGTGGATRYTHPSGRMSTVSGKNSNGMHTVIHYDEKGKPVGSSDQYDPKIAHAMAVNHMTNGAKKPKAGEPEYIDHVTQGKKQDDNSITSAQHEALAEHHKTAGNKEWADYHANQADAKKHPEGSFERYKRDQYSPDQMAAMYGKFLADGKLRKMIPVTPVPVAANRLIKVVRSEKNG